VLFVTHKLHEATAITDRVTILRDGRAVASLCTAATNAGEIVRAMTGRNVNLKVEKRPLAPGDPLLKAVDLTIASPSGKLAVDCVSLTVRGGEIVGIAGVAGNGQNELVEALVGLRNPDGGRVEVGGRDVTVSDVTTHRAAGLAYIPEDRAAVGSAAEASAADNLAMGFHRSAPLASGPFINPSAFAERARALIRRFAIRIANERVNVGTLSGGNLQKVVVARELAHEAPALIAEQPTRGLDVGATEHIHGLLVAERDRGRAILLVSAELNEILGLSNRVLVIFEGRILADLPQERADEHNVGLFMAGRGAEGG
jgi:general nucleoside transport system ATP-binding protein